MQPKPMSRYVQISFHGCSDVQLQAISMHTGQQNRCPSVLPQHAKLAPSVLQPTSLCCHCASARRLSSSRRSFRFSSDWAAALAGKQIHLLSFVGMTRMSCHCPLDHTGLKSVLALLRRVDRSATPFAGQTINKRPIRLTG